jgi:hypothetical protein
MAVVGEHIKRTIATEDLIVFDPQIGIDRHVFAGQPVPISLEEAYAEAGGKAVSAEPADVAAEAAGEATQDTSEGTTEVKGPTKPQAAKKGK